MVNIIFGAKMELFGAETILFEIWIWCEYVIIRCQNDINMILQDEFWIGTNESVFTTKIFAPNNSVLAPDHSFFAPKSSINIDLFNSFLAPNNNILAPNLYVLYISFSHQNVLISNQIISFSHQNLLFSTLPNPMLLLGAKTISIWSLVWIRC